MPMNPQLMQLVGGGGAGGPAPQGAPQGPAAGPAGSPMSNPQVPEGDKQNAIVTVSMAMDLLAHTIPGLGVKSEEGQAVMDCLTKLGKHFGTARTKSKDLIPAELMQLMGSLPQAGGMSPEAKAMGQQPMPGGMQPGAMPH